MRRPFSLAIALAVLAACGSDRGSPDGAASTTAATTAATSAETTETEPTAADDAEQRFPDVIGATARRNDGTWTFSATLSSPYDTPQRYADAWRILAPDGTELGIRELAHDHAGEQPFTRSTSGVVVPDGVTTVSIQGRDLVHGWGGSTFEIELPATDD